MSAVVSMTVECQSCHRKYNVGQDHFGSTVRCKNCRNPVEVPGVIAECQSEPKPRFSTAFKSYYIIIGICISFIAFLSYQGYQSVVTNHKSFVVHVEQERAAEPQDVSVAEQPVTTEEKPFIPHPDPMLLVASPPVKSIRSPGQEDNTVPAVFVSDETSTPPVTIDIVSTTIGKISVGGNALLGTTTSDTVLCIKVQITNNRDQQILYQSWSGEILTPDGRNLGRAWDDKGNHLARRYASSSKFGPRPKGRVSQQLLRKGDCITDVLVFDAPREGFTHIDLELPSFNLGGLPSREAFHIQIPASGIERE